MLETFQDDFAISPVKDFYKGRNIFITGGTGYLGKLLLSKLLRSCPNGGRIYLLIRPKKGQTVNERLNNLLKNISLLIENVDKNTLKVINAIEGDFTLPRLGISAADRTLLQENVSVVFHLGATVNFGVQLKLSVQVNLIATKNVIELCQEMSNLSALVHVSTAYSNCDRQRISEQIYTQEIGPDQMIKLINSFDESVVNQLTPAFLNGKPNTYTFTKALAESALKEYGAQLPIAIVRPSIVLSTKADPFPGWVDNMYGPTGVVAAGFKCLINAVYGDGTKIIDCIPADIVVNTILCVAWRTALTKSKDIDVYNCCSGQQNPITLFEFTGMCDKYIKEYPTSDSYWYPSLKLTLSVFHKNIACYLYQLLPAYIIDTYAKITGQKPRMMDIQNKLRKSEEYLEFFETREWNFEDNNMKNLSALLADEDKKEFPMDVKDINWDVCVKDYVLGIRRFLLNESPDTIPKARDRLKKLTYFYRLLQSLVLFVWIYHMWGFILCYLTI